ncbi:MAG TPA: hypothetical protein VM243_08790 [Phycisphaerae bacterium]|nr:hypothetical protein [Phycisphaerae bacterium]
MSSSLADFLVKFADNTHLGKVATNLAPGIILTVAILLLLTSFTELEVFPYSGRQQARHRADAARKEAVAATGRVEERQEQVDRLEAEVQHLSLSGEAKARKNAELSMAQKSLQRALAEQGRRLEDAANANAGVEEALLLKTNLDVLAEHFIALFIAGYILGSVLAQVSGRLFYTGRYYRYLKKYKKKTYDILYARPDRRTETYFTGKITDEAFLARLPNLGADYYRYLEVTMNMILPLGALTATLLAIGVRNLVQAPWPAAVFPLVLAFVSGLVTFALFDHGRIQYVGYFKRKADRLTLLIEKVEEQKKAGAGG